MATNDEPRHLQPGSRHRVLKIVSAAVAAVVVLAAIGVFVAYRHLSGNITALDPTKDLGSNRPSKIVKPHEPNKPLNILLIGSDTRKGQHGHFGAVSGARSDTTILLHINAQRTLAYGVSIPRDSMVRRPSCKTANGTVVPAGLDMWNAAFSYGGPGCTWKQVEQTTHVHVDHFIEIDFNGFRDMVNALGGVQVCLPYSVSDPHSKIYLPAGTHTFMGAEALKYVREREGFPTGSDITRTKRQQAFLASMAHKAISTGTLLDIPRLYSFLDAATKSVTTDPGLASLAHLAGLAESLKHIGPSHIQFVTVPTKPWPRNPNRVVWKPLAKKIWRNMRYDKPLPRSMMTQVTTAAGQGGKHQPGEGKTPGKESRRQAAKRAQQARENGLCT